MLTPTDLHFVLSRLPKDVRTIIKNRNLILGGGFIRSTISGEPPSDIDLFGADRSALELAYRDLSDLRPEARRWATGNAFTVLQQGRMPVQFIHRWLFAKPEDCALSFDFTVCQAVVWYSHDRERWQSHCPEVFYPDLAAKRLVYTSPVRAEEAGGSLMRVVKFLRRGYNIQARSLAAVVARVAKDFPAIYSGNVDEFTAADCICSRLLEVDPLVVIDGIELGDEHEHDPALA